MHISEACFQIMSTTRVNFRGKNFLSAAARASPNGVENVPRKTPVCYYCKEEGHVVKNCQKTPCRRCNKKGHRAGDCTTPKCEDCQRFGHGKDECWTCERCQQKGHLAEKCRTNICEECGKTGHATEKCFSRLTCDLCLRRGHDEDHCRTEPWCPTCKEDHFPGSCRFHTNRECGLCGETGHTAKQCKNGYVVH